MAVQVASVVHVSESARKSMTHDDATRGRGCTCIGGRRDSDDGAAPKLPLLRVARDQFTSKARFSDISLATG